MFKSNIKKKIGRQIKGLKIDNGGEQFLPHFQDFAYKSNTYIPTFKNIIIISKKKINRQF